MRPNCWCIEAVIGNIILLERRGEKGSSVGAKVANVYLNLLPSPGLAEVATECSLFANWHHGAERERGSELAAKWQACSWYRLKTLGARKSSVVYQ